MGKLGSSHSTVEGLSYWVCIYGRKIHIGKLGSSHSTVGRGHLRGTLFWYSFMVLIYGTHLWYSFMVLIYGTHL